MNSLIAKALENRFLTMVTFMGIAIFGIVTIWKTPVDALPDLSENQVVIMTEWPGQSPKNVEDQVTFPLSVSMQGLAKVKRIRSMSQLGLSMVTVIFEDSVDIYFGRNRVAERLSMVREQLPAEVNPVLGPDATALGQIFMYTLNSDRHSLTDLRTLQDFTVQYALQSVPGVAEVAAVGGYVKTYQVVVDPTKLQQYGVNLSEIMEAIRTGNANVSGKVVSTSQEDVAIQGIGFFQAEEDLKNIVLGKRPDSVPLTIGDIGEVRASGLFRRTILADENSEKVGGVVIMRYGENPLAVIDRIKVKIAELQKILPEGVTIEPFYDRTKLIRDTIHTLQRVITEELVITMIVLGIFLWHAGSTLITAICLIVGILMTFIGMTFFGIPSNIMSLGGIAIAIGTMIDASIVVSENAYRKLMEHPPATLVDRIHLVTEATLEVGKPILFALLITILSFLPIFALEGMEGKLFGPLAYTHTFALMGAIIAGLFLSPLLSVYLLRGKLSDDAHIPAVAFFQRLYKPILLWSLRSRKKIFSMTAAITIISTLTMFRIGSEFMPPLDEGAIMYMPITVPNASEKQVRELLLATNAIIADIPEVEKVVGKAGRARSATDPAPLSMIETIITLKPKSEWREGMTKTKLIVEMNKNIKLEKLWNGFTQPIIGRVDMLATGIRSQVGLKIFGDDPEKLESLAIEAESLVAEVPGAIGVAAIRTMGLKYLNIELNEDLLAQYEIRKGDVLEAISAGVGGVPIATTIEGRKRFDIEVRLQQPYRQDLEDVKSLPIAGEGGMSIPLSSLADITEVDGPTELQSENGVLRSVVQLNVSGRDLVSFVEEAKAYLEQQLKLPAGYSLQWTGQYENHLRVAAKFSWLIPLVIFVIFILLYLTYKDLWLVALVMLTLPLGLGGGVLALFLTGYNFSVSVWVGFITLFGVAASMGIVKVVYLENAFRRRFGLALIEGEESPTLQKKVQAITHEGIREAVIEGALIRLRPILMTGLAAIIGLIPMVATTGVGSEVTKPLAIVMMGGLITVVAFTIIVLPVLFATLRERKVPTQ